MSSRDPPLWSTGLVLTLGMPTTLSPKSPVTSHLQSPFILRSILINEIKNLNAAICNSHLADFRVDVPTTFLRVGSAEKTKYVALWLDPPLDDFYESKI